jgi:flagellar motor protein MotB
MRTLPFPPLGDNRPVAAASLSALAAAGGAADAVLDGYPEYATGVTQLDPDQRRVLTAVADRIVRSHLTLQPIDAVLVVGHADKALRKAVAERAGFELDISRQRASSARLMLLDAAQTLAGGAHFSKVLLVVDVGIGNGRPVFASAATEAQMRKNRRVEIFLFQSNHSPTHCALR